MMSNRLRTWIYRVVFAGIVMIWAQFDFRVYVWLAIILTFFFIVNGVACAISLIKGVLEL